MKKARRVLTEEWEVSKIFCPTGRNADEEALICLDCDLDESECDGEDTCPRYQQRMKELQGADDDKGNS